MIERPRIVVIVVDNDPQRSASGIINELYNDYEWPLVYAVQSQAGIPQARNTCLAHVEPETDFVCFVDDDEVVEPAWLEQLLLTQRRYDADVVAGPVRPIFPAVAPNWVRTGRLFRPYSHRTGDTISEAATSNVLFKLSLAIRYHIRFYEKMALTGGTDKLFFEQLRMRGAKMIWCDEAIVHEVIPTRRLRPIWFIQRGFRVGTTDARTARITKGTWRGTASSVWRAASRGSWALLFLPLYIALGKGPFIYNVSRLAYSVGSLLGTFGISYNEYVSMRHRKVPE
jgi:glycosyltransferase involved in cell wall biosynthesis